jgi:hypothetical protein
MTMTDREVREEARRRVRAGFLWLMIEGQALALDGRINPETVDVESVTACPLSQAGRDTFPNVVARLERCGVPVRNTKFLMEHGFSVDLAPEDLVSRKALNTAWRNLLNLHSAVHEAEEAVLA